MPVCEACVRRVTPYKAPGCWRCGEAEGVSLDMEDIRFSRAVRVECRVCKAVPPDFARAVAYGLHDGELRELIALLKFNRVRGVADLMGGRLAQAVLQLEGEAAPHLLVVAVPLFAARERWRGFNQSVLLADAALKYLGRMRPGWRLTRAHSLLQRVRETESSFRLSPKGRRDNLRGAFRVTQDVLAREVLLIDDIYTSGATARECARMLMRAGAAKVWVATLARAQKQSAVQQSQDSGEAVALWDMQPQTAMSNNT